MACSAAPCVDVCVVGGGPAGSALAGRLARLGHSIVLIERHAFPRPHVGESLPPVILPLLDALGAREAVENAGFLRPAGVVVKWAEPAARQQEIMSAAFQVDRGRFDAILLDNARAAGVRIMQPARVLAAVFRKGAWRSCVQSAGDETVVVSRLLVDASGRRKWLKGPVRLCGSRTLALYGYWRCAPRVGPETRVEAGDCEWYWGAPLPDGSFNAAVFVDPVDYRLGLRAHGGRNGLYHALIARSVLLPGCVRGAPPGGIHVADATAYVDEVPIAGAPEQPVGRASERPVDRSTAPVMLKVGEAAFAIDPLSSQGVQSALGSALHAAAAAHTMLAKPQDADLAVDFYRRAVLEAATFHTEQAAAAYQQAAVSRPSRFWEQRASRCAPPREPAPAARPIPAGDSIVQLADGVRIEPAPLLRGDFIVSGSRVRIPGRAQPVAFLGDVELAPLLEPLTRPVALSQLLHTWQARLSRDRAVSTLGWLWTAGALRVVESPASGHPGSPLRTCQ